MEVAKSIMTACINLLMGHPLVALVPCLGFSFLRFTRGD